MSGTGISLHTSDPDIQSLTGCWEIRFPHGWGTPTRFIVDSLKSWTEMEPESVRYFSGEAIYYKSFNQHVGADDTKSQIVLDLGEVSKVAEVYLNGHHLGIKWFSPYSYDITDIIKPGKNYLIVEVANVWSNQLTGDAKRSWNEKRTHTNIIKGPNAWMTPYAELKLVKSGLIGPVTIRSFDKILLKKD